MPINVHELCQQRGLSIDQLSQLAGLDVGRTTAIFLGRWTPSPDERKAIAAALKVEVADITWGHATPIQHLYGHGPG
jgi:transcriptional regulator with XRE-family HTH domain